MAQRFVPIPEFCAIRPRRPDEATCHMCAIRYQPLDDDVGQDDNIGA